MFALGSHLPRWLWIQDGAVCIWAGLQEPCRGQGRMRVLHGCGLHTGHSLAAPPSPPPHPPLPTLPWPPSQSAWYCRWGIPLSPLLLVSVAFSNVHTSRFRPRFEVFQDVTFLPANFLALLHSDDLQAVWGPTPSLTNYFISLQMANCAKGQSHSHPFNGYQAVFWKLIPRTGCDCPIVGSWHSVAQGAMEWGPELFRFILFQRFLCSSNQMPK